MAARPTIVPAGTGTWSFMRMMSRQVMRRVPLAGRYLPVGLAAKLAFDVSTPAFGYQESHTCNDATHEVLPGTPVVRDGYLWPSLEPGFGVNFDKKAASRLPPVKFRFDRWAAGVRRPDGSLEPP